MEAKTDSKLQSGRDGDGTNSNNRSHDKSAADKSKGAREGSATGSKALEGGRS